MSDSDDDGYGNAALKLQKLKNKFKQELTNKFHELKTAPQLSDSKQEVPSIKPDLLDDGGVLDEILAQNARKRVTRGKKKTSDCNDGVTKTSTRGAARGRKRGRSSTRSPRRRGRSRHSPCDVMAPPQDPTVDTSIAEITASSSSIRTRRAVRGRRTRGTRPSPRGRNRQRQWDYYANSISQDLPIYSVGNTLDYPDMSDNQALFTTTPSETIDINDSLEENEELSVKVYWQSTEFFKFAIRKYQKLTQIFNYFAKKENVSHSNLLLMYNERILNPNDTPDSIKYSIAKFIDGGIINEKISTVPTQNEILIKDGIKLKFQCQLIKKPFETVVGLDEKLLIIMLKFAEHLEKPLNKLKFQFDGDTLSGKSTPKELELEGGECIDVTVLS